MQICLVKSACSARNRSSKYRYFFKKNNRQSIRDKYTTQLLRVESIRNAFNGILSYNICVTQLIFSSMQFNSICRYVLGCFLNYETYDHIFQLILHYSFKEVLTSITCSKSNTLQFMRKTCNTQE